MRSLPVLMLVFFCAAAYPQVSAQSSLPDAPSAMLAQQEQVVVVAEAYRQANGEKIKPCSVGKAVFDIRPTPKTIGPIRIPCDELFNPYQRFLDSEVVIPLTSEQKGYLALHNLTSPANLMTVVAISGFTIGINSHTAYGPGWKGFGKNVGVSLLQDATGEFFGTYLIPSIAHEDPRYRRLGKGSVSRRFLHAVSRTVIAQHDDGSRMPNYAVLLTYPINTEISNLYVPGIHSDPASSMARIVTGLATDPANNLISEFLPDVARRVNIRIVFVQRLLNQVASERSGSF